MLIWLELVIIIILLALWWRKNDNQYYANSPPGIETYRFSGPPRFPFIGNILQIIIKSAYPAVAFQKLSDKYGDVMFLKMGPAETVVFSSCDTIHEILTHEKALHRVQYQFIQDRHNKQNLGIIWGDDRPWQKLRKFTVRNLRDFGFGKSSTMDAVLNEEFDKFSDYIASQARAATNNIIHVEDLFSLAVMNVLWRFVSGKPYEYNDPRMLKLLQLNSSFFRSTNMGFDLSDCYPVLRDWFPNWSGRTGQIKTSQELVFYGHELLEEHKQLGTYKGDPDSFLDAFWAKVEIEKEKSETDFNIDQFVMSILDLLIAGSETSSNTLTFGILYMLLYPEIQEKIYKEIEREVPKDIPIDCSMKTILPYTTATVLEIFRFSTVVPTPAARQASEDFFFRGYNIRKGTGLIYNVHAVHFSETLWGDPKNFRPERFLTSDGATVDTKLADLLQVFGAGKRVCLGMSLAEASIFLFFASSIRRFKFVKVPGTNPTTKPVLGVTLAPHPFNVRIVDRCEL